MADGNGAGRIAGRWREFADWVEADRMDLMLGAAVALAISIVLIGVRSFGHRLIRDTGGPVSWRSIFGRALTRTSLFFIVMSAAKLVLGQAEGPAGLERLVDTLFIIAAAFQGAVWARELILGFIQHRVGDTDAQGNLTSALGIIRLLVTVALFAIAIVVILDNLGVNVTGLVAGLGIGGIAIGLAAQGIFSDLFAALSIIFDRPFRKGDSITFGTTTGTVEHIGLKSTRVRALSGEEVVISNTKLLEQQVQNWALLRRRRVVMQFGIIYQTPADLIARLPLEVEEIVKAQPLAAFDRCHAFQFGPSSIDFELVFHVDTADFADTMAVRQAVMLGMIRRFEELGVSFAYPTQMGFLAGLDGKPIDPREVPPALHPAP